MVSNILNNSSRLFLWFFVPLIVVYSFWLVLFYPGIMTPDSVDQIIQAENWNFSDWHPYLSAVYLALGLKIYNSPATIAFLNILFTSLLFAYAFSFFWRNNVNKKVLGFLYFLLLFSIPIGLYNITLWKDVPFSIVTVAVSFLIAKKYFDKKAWNIWELTFLAFLSSLATVLRHNGILFLFFIPLLFLVVFWKDKLKFLFIGLYIIFYLFFAVLLPKLLDVHEKPFWATGPNLFAYYMSANIYANQPITHITPALKNTLEQAFDKPESIKKLYNNVSWDSIFFDIKHVKHDTLNREDFWRDLKKEFYKNNLLPNLDYIIASRVNSFLTTTFGFGSTHGATTAPITIFKNKNLNSGFENKYLIKDVTNYFSKNILSLRGRTSLAGFFIWNLFVIVVLLSVLILISIIKNKNYTFLIFASIIFIQLTAIFVFAVASEWRYYYFVYLSIFLAIPIYLLTNNRNDNKPQSN